MGSTTKVSDPSRFEVRLARTADEIAAAQRLRYRVFVAEMGAKASPVEHALRLEFDEFDPFFDHLILIDRKHVSPDPLDHVVGVYRLMRGDVAKSGPGFYGASEYDLAKLQVSGRSLVELGRSCVGADYRGGTAMLMLWNALADYVATHEIEILFGVASFPGNDPVAIAEALSNLHRNHLAPQDIRVRALPGRFLDMDRNSASRVDVRRAMQDTPPLIKGYLRHGGFVGEGAVIDVDFNTVDVCLVMDTRRMTARYRKFYQRKSQLQ